MTRDLSLCREILLAIEARAPGDVDNPVEIAGRTRDEVNYQISLLAQAGYLEARSMGTLEAPMLVVPLRILWAGHDFLDATRDPAVWDSAMKKAGGRFASLGLDMAKDLCVALIKAHLGLGP